MYLDTEHEDGDVDLAPYWATVQQAKLQGFLHHTVVSERLDAAQDLLAAGDETLELSELYKLLKSSRVQNHIEQLSTIATDTTATADVPQENSIAEAMTKKQKTSF